MDLHTVSIGTHTLTLDPRVDLARLQRRMAKLIKHGGGVIEIPTSGSDRFTALLSPGLPVLFHTRQLSEDDLSAAHDDENSSPYPGDSDFEYL